MLHTVMWHVTSLSLEHHRDLLIASEPIPVINPLLSKDYDVSGRAAAKVVDTSWVTVSLLLIEVYLLVVA